MSMEDYDAIKNRARSILTAGLNSGLSFLQQVASNLSKDDDTSDEKAFQESIVDDENFINNGVRGIIVFFIASIADGKKEALHLYLYKSIICVYSKNGKYYYPTTDIVNITRLSELKVQIETKSNGVKVLLFEQEVMAYKFHMYVEYLNEQGANIRKAFNAIDYTKSGRICKEDLEKALMKTDLVVTSDDVDKMYVILTPNSFILPPNKRTILTFL